MTQNYIALLNGMHALVCSLRFVPVETLTKTIKREIKVLDELTF